MRFTPARGLAIAGAIVTVLAAAACSSISSSSSTAGGTQIPVTSTTPSGAATGASASASSGGSGAGTSTGAGAEIKANWEKFFASSTPASERVKLLQNGAKFASAINAFASSPLAQGVSSTVTAVSAITATNATVTYNIDAAGQTMASKQSGKSVLEGGVWKVGDASFCSLLTEAAPLMNITVPAACKSVS
jgi:hypothetical protein